MGARSNGINHKSEEESKTWPQILAIVTAGLASTTCGLHFAWTSPFIVKITKDKENYDITEDEASYFTIIGPATMILTSTIFSKLSDMIGRKKTLMLIVIPHLTAWILTAVGTNVYFFYASRIASGIGDACHFAAVPVYIGEISTPKIRGTWGNAVTGFIYFGQFLINVIGSYFTVRQTAYICMTLPVIFIISMSLMPESPYFCIMKGNEEGAKKSLRFLRGKLDVDIEYDNLRIDVERQMSETGTWKDLVMIRSNRKALYAGIFLRISQQLSGVAVLNVYTQYIFDKAETNIPSEISTMVFAGLLFVLALLFGFIMEMFGRKKSYISSLISCSVVLLALAVYFYLDQETDVHVKFMNWFPVAGMLAFVTFTCFGLAILPTMMLGELFSTSIKAKGISILTLMFGLCVFVTNNIFYSLNSSFGLFAPFLFFGCCNIVSSILSVYLVPETKGKTLEEIQQSLKKTKAVS